MKVQFPEPVQCISSPQLVNFSDILITKSWQITKHYQHNNLPCFIFQINYQEIISIPRTSFNLCVLLWKLTNQWSFNIATYLIICFLPCLGKDWLDLLDACIFMEIFLFFSKQCNGSFAGILIIKSWQKLLHIATRYIQGVQTWTSFSNAITVVDGLTFLYSL